MGGSWRWAEPELAADSWVADANSLTALHLAAARPSPGVGEEGGDEKVLAGPVRGLLEAEPLCDARDAAGRTHPGALRRHIRA